jgi:hypothetical protein
MNEACKQNQIGGIVKYSFLLTAVLVLLIAGCASMDASRLQDASIRRPPNQLSLAPGYDVYLIREDLVRGTHSESRTYHQNGKTVTRTETVENEYSELLIDFGNGIVMDYNNNLCVDLMRFYGLTEKRSFAIAKKPIGFSMKSDISYVRQDAKFESSLGAGRDVTFSADGIEINEHALFSPKRYIEAKGNEIFLRGKFLGFKVNQSVKLENPSTLKLIGFWKDVDVTKEFANQIAIEKYFKINRQDDRVVVVYSGIFGLSTMRTFVRTDDGFIFFDEHNYRVEVEKKGNVITVSRNGKPKVQYILERI